MKDVYKIVTEKILAELDKGEVPWRKPWKIHPAMNWASGKTYRGMNRFLLDPGEYLTFKQAKDAGGHVKKGETGHLVIFYKLILVDDKGKPGEKKSVPWLQYYTVFEVSQCEGIERKHQVNANHDPISSAVEIVKGYKNPPELRHDGKGASYNPSSDRITMPPVRTFSTMEEYYSTLFHECGHSTGHVDRLARKGVTDTQGFGTDPYAQEELIAEMAAAMLCGVAGIGNTIENSAAYIAGWKKRIAQDEKVIVKSAAAAQKAADYILGGSDNNGK